ncbi:hypothetical protein FRB99_007514 [Tulasnella sp. 403]|nr:hypothetical protein FRB99_007514 [Tulasnella sp. 403]
MDISVMNLKCLTGPERTALKNANLTTVADVLIPSINDISRKTRISNSEIDRLVHKISAEILEAPVSVFDDRICGAEGFTTGDKGLDDLIGGKLRSSAVWEVAGASASGKTQLALQLSLTVQLPKEDGGVAGSSCYITTHSNLPTERLNQILQQNPLLSNKTSLSDIHTCSVATYEALQYYLREGVLGLMNELQKSPDRKPLKLIIVDSVAAPFRSASELNAFVRTKRLGEISKLLHHLVSTYNLAAVIINDVTAVFEPNHSIKSELSHPAELLYSEQSRWFLRPDDTYLDEKQDAALGLVWSNQINARLFLSRTGRTTAWDEEEAEAEQEQERARKRRRIEWNFPGTQSSVVSTVALNSKRVQMVLLRRVDVVFSCFSPARSVDFVITPSGFQTIPSLTREENESYFGGPVEVDAAEQERLAESAALAPVALPRSDEAYDPDLLFGEDDFLDDFELTADGDFVDSDPNSKVVS